MLPPIDGLKMMKKEKHKEFDKKISDITNSYQSPTFTRSVYSGPIPKQPTSATTKI